MAKQSGLGARLLLAGFDLSGDISAIDSIGGTTNLLDVTDITQSAHSRIPGLRDGMMSFTSFWDAQNATPVLDALPTADVLMTAIIPPVNVIGSPAACLQAKQIDYPNSRGSDGGLTAKVDGQGDGYALEWGVLLTPYPRTDTTPTNGTSLDGGSGFTAPSVPASGTAAANTSPLPASVVVTGGTVSSVVVNDVSVGTGDGTYTVPAGQSITLTYSEAPTWTWTMRSAYGAQSYLQVTSFDGTSVTVTVQQAPDNSTWTTLAAFTAADAAPATQRVAVTGDVGRWLRVITTGTFSSATFAVMVNRNQAVTNFAG